MFAKIVQLVPIAKTSVRLSALLVLLALSVLPLATRPIQSYVKKDITVQQEVLFQLAVLLELTTLF